MEGQYKFEDLLPYDSKQNYLKLMRDISTGIIECNEPRDQVLMINELRRMRKYHMDLFEKTFSNILKCFVDNCLQSSNGFVLGISIKLVSEIFSYYDFDFIDNGSYWIPTLLEQVLQHAICNDDCIRKLACEALDNLANNMVYQQTIESLITNMNDESDDIAQVASEYLRLFITLINNVVLINQFDWGEIYSVITELYTNKNIKFLNRAGYFLYQVKGKLENEFYTFMNSLAEEHRTMTDELITNFVANANKY
jgi:hypothetical protein